MSPPSRQSQKAATRERVLEAARDEFEAVGFEAANVRSIAARAEVAAGTVLHHFGEKRELLYAALFDDLEATIDRALLELSRGGDLERRASALGSLGQRRPPLKAAVGGETSDRQWRDVLGVMRAQAGRLELDYLRRWSQAQGTLDLLERVLNEATR
ncbi:MAG: TetR/AcrR family transcriptional regulator [Myxococcus sp.]|nr:TetR/AcrR family transcriptional regulator [Myxococcus sp.]